MPSTTRKKLPQRKRASVGEIGKQIRLLVLQMSEISKSGETGSSLSVSDILAVLYFRVLEIDPKRPRDPLRDRLILSKGHAAAALYAALALRGFFSLKLLTRHRLDGGTFHAHPSIGAAPGIEVSTGSLGHGLSIGAGMAEALKETRARVFVLLGDGECNEGAVWEAARHLGALQMPNIVTIVDDNRFQGYPLAREKQPANLSKMWAACGWRVFSVDGHDAGALERAIRAAAALKRPAVVIARTVTGKGVPEIEHTQGAHYYVADAAAVERMRKSS
jgi:transketolase